MIIKSIYGINSNVKGNETIAPGLKIFDKKREERKNRGWRNSGRNWKAEQNILFWGG